MFYTFDWGVIEKSWTYLIFEGLYFSLLVTGITTCFSMILGIFLVILTRSKNKVVSTSAFLYVGLFRSLPLVLFLFWFFFFMPFVFGWITNSPRPVQIDIFYTVLITFILVYSAYFCEIFRTGLEAIPTGQYEAANSLGLSKFQCYRLIIFPQVFRNTVPILLMQTVTIFQDTSAVWVISAIDFLGAATMIARQENRLVELYIFAAIIYLLISFVVSSYVRYLQKKSIAIE